MRRSWAILTLVLSFASDAYGDDVDELRTRLRAGVERSGVTTPLRDESASALIAIFEDEREVRHVRLRALFALTRLQGATTIDFFSALLSRPQDKSASNDPLDPQRSTLVLRRAIEGLVHAAPNDRSVSLIADYLEHHDGRVREAVARGLVQVRSAQARQLASARLSVETSKHVRAQLSLLTATDPPARPTTPLASDRENEPRPR